LQLTLAGSRSHFAAETVIRCASGMSDDAHWFAIRAWTVCGAVGGGLVGFLVAPRLQWRLRLLGIDQVAFGPALIIIVLAALFGGVVAWCVARR